MAKIQYNGDYINIDPKEISTHLKNNTWYENLPIGTEADKDDLPLINMVDPLGKKTSLTFTPEAMRAAVDAGYRFESTGEAYYSQIEDEYGEDITDQAVAGLLGTARGLSFGLSDLLVPDEAQRKYQLANPGLSLTGEIIGAAGPAIATGGSSALGLSTKAPSTLGAISKVASAGKSGKGLYALTKNFMHTAKNPLKITPTAMVSDIGLAAEKGIIGMMKETNLPLWMKNAAGRGVGGAIEGSLGGFAEAFNSSVVYDTDLSADTITAYSAIGGLFGTGIGSATAVLGGFKRGLFGGVPFRRLPNHEITEKTLIGDAKKGIASKGLYRIVRAQLENEFSDLSTSEINKLTVKTLQNESFEEIYNRMSNWYESMGGSYTSTDLPSMQKALKGAGKKPDTYDKFLGRGAFIGKWPGGPGSREIPFKPVTIESPKTQDIEEAAKRLGEDFFITDPDTGTLKWKDPVMATRVDKIGRMHEMLEVEMRIFRATKIDEDATIAIYKDPRNIEKWNAVDYNYMTTRSFSSMSYTPRSAAEELDTSKEAARLLRQALKSDGIDPDTVPLPKIKPGRPVSLTKTQLLVLHLRKFEKKVSALEDFLSVRHGLTADIIRSPLKTDSKGRRFINIENDEFLGLKQDDRLIAVLNKKTGEFIQSMSSDIQNEINKWIKSNKKKISSVGKLAAGVDWELKPKKKPISEMYKLNRWLESRASARVRQAAELKQQFGDDPDINKYTLDEMETIAGNMSEANFERFGTHASEDVLWNEMYLARKANVDDAWIKFRVGELHKRAVRYQRKSNNFELDLENMPEAEQSNAYYIKRTLKLLTDNFGTELDRLALPAPGVYQNLTKWWGKVAPTGSKLDWILPTRLAKKAYAGASQIVSGKEYGEIYKYMVDSKLRSQALEWGDALSKIDRNWEKAGHWYADTITPKTEKGTEKAYLGALQFTLGGVNEEIIEAIKAVNLRTNIANRVTSPIDRAKFRGEAESLKDSNSILFSKTKQIFSKLGDKKSRLADRVRNLSLKYKENTGLRKLADDIEKVANKFNDLADEAASPGNLTHELKDIFSLSGGIFKQIDSTFEKELNKIKSEEWSYVVKKAKDLNIKHESTEELYKRTVKKLMKDPLDAKEYLDHKYRMVTLGKRHAEYKDRLLSADNEAITELRKLYELQEDNVFRKLFNTLQRRTEAVSKRLDAISVDSNKVKDMLNAARESANVAAKLDYLAKLDPGQVQERIIRSIIAMGGGGLAGFSYGGDVGGMGTLGALGYLLANPAIAVRGLHKARKSFLKGYEAAASTIIKGGSIPTKARIALKPYFTHENVKDRIEDIERSDDSVVIGEIERETKHLDRLSPEIKEITKSRLASNAELLRSLAPKRNSSGEYNKKDIDAFIVAANIIDNPEFAVEALQKQEFTSLHRKVLKKAYPALYGDMCRQMIEYLQKDDTVIEDIPYKRRRQIEILLGNKITPIDDITPLPLVNPNKVNPNKGAGAAEPKQEQINQAAQQVLPEAFRQ